MFIKAQHLIVRSSMCKNRMLIHKLISELNNIRPVKREVLIVRSIGGQVICYL